MASFEADRLISEYGFTKDQLKGFDANAIRAMLKKQDSRKKLGIEQHTLNDYQTMPYADYLKTERWKVIRRKAINRAGYRCQLCNSNKRLQVHHRTYKRRGCELPGDLTVLCVGCHLKHHGVSIKS